MVAAFDVELPFPVRDTRRRRLSVGEVQTYRDIALTRGHAGNTLKGAKNAFAVGSVEAARLADIMRQVDITAAGSLGRQDFMLALDRAAVLLGDEDRDHLFRALQSAGTGRGCDIEMFAQLVKFWAGSGGGNAPLALAADARKYTPRTDGPSSSRVLDLSALGAPGAGRASPRTNACDAISAGDRSEGFNESPTSDHETESNKSHGENSMCPSSVAGNFGAGPSANRAAAGKKSSFSTNMTDLLNHSPRQDGRAYAPRHPIHTAATPNCGCPAASQPPTSRNMSESHAFLDQRSHERGNGGAVEKNGQGVGLDNPVACGETEVHNKQNEAPDEAYMHSLGYGNLGSVLPILLDRRAALEASVERLDRSGTGRIKPGDFMAAVRQIGVALSPVQQANMMDLLEKMDCVLSGGDSCAWIEAKASLDAIALAGYKAGGRNFHEKARSFFEEGTRLLDTVSSHYPEVHLSLLPSSILVGPAALQERREAKEDGADKVFVTSGSLRKALRSAGVLLGDTDERTLWRLLLRRAQQAHSRSIQDGIEADAECVQEIAHFLERGMIPLLILDDVMGFDAEEALRIQRNTQQQRAHQAPIIPAPYEDHVGASAGSVAPDGAGRDRKSNEAPLLLQKARLRVKALGSTPGEREQGLLACLPKLGPTAERERFPRTELTRLLQRLRAGVRSGELQNLWYHMDRNKVTRSGFRKIILDEADSLPVTFPASPCPYPAAPGPPRTPTENSVDGGRSECTPIGEISVSGARLQRALNRAAYEENVRRAAGSAVTYGTAEEDGDDQEPTGMLPPPPYSESVPKNVPDTDSVLPVLLQKATKQIEEMDKGLEAVFALVPDMGRIKDCMRITRGAIQRALHGLGVVPRAGELQQLWWALEKGGVGGPRLSVEDFRSLLQGRITKLQLLPDWTVVDENNGDVTGKQASSTERLHGVGVTANEAASPSKRTMRQVKTSLGLVRRRVNGVIRGCQDRDLSGDGWVTEETFISVLREQGILQQLGTLGISALTQAVVSDKVVEKDAKNRQRAGGGRAAAAAAARVVRYTAIVGAIDLYLDGMVSSDVVADLAPRSPPTRHESPIQGNENQSPPCVAFSAGDNAPASPPPIQPPSNVIATRVGPSTALTNTANRHFVTRSMHESPMNSVARAARGWDNDAPEIPLGMRHFPHKNSRMAAIVGGGDTLLTGAGIGKQKDNQLHVKGTPPQAVLEQGDTALTANTNQNNTPSRTQGMRELLDWGNADSRYKPGDAPVSSPSRPPANTRYADFVPAGGNPGLMRPTGSGGRRGSVDKVVSLAGGGVARAIYWHKESEGGVEEGAMGSGKPHEQDTTEEVPRMNCTNEMRGNGDADSSSPHGHLEAPPSTRRRRQTKAGELRGLMEAWPEAPKTLSNHDDASNGDTNASLGETPASPRRVSPIQRPPDAMRGLLQDRACRSSTARTLLQDRALLAGVFRQLSGVGSRQAIDGLDRAGLAQLFRYPRMQLGLSEKEAEDLADAALAYAGSQTVRFPSLTSFLTVQAEGHDNGDRAKVYRQRDVDYPERSMKKAVRMRDDPIAQSIKRTVMQGRSELRLAGGDEENRLSCAVHLRRAFRKRRKNLGGDPGGVDDCSVGATDLPGLLQDLGVALNPTQSAFIIQSCCARPVLGRRLGAGGKTEAPVKAGDVLPFFTQLLSD